MPQLSLTTRSILFTATVILALVVGSALITSSVLKNGLLELFEQRFARTGEVLDQYVIAYTSAKRTELVSVLSSPRFLAAVETQDASTIANEARSYEKLLHAWAIVIVDTTGSVLYCTEWADSSLARAVRSSPPHGADLFSLHCVVVGDEIIEMVTAEIISNSGEPLGWLAVGSPCSAQLTADLKRLTGFDVAVYADQRLIGTSEGALATIVSFLGKTPYSQIESATEMTRQEVDGENIMFSSHSNAQLGTTVTFLASLDEHLDPIMSQMRKLLILLAGLGLFVSIIAVSLFTQRQLGRQIGHLVDAAKRIGGGELKFKIIPQSKDELGYLAESIEQMRSQILADRTELERVHAERMHADRLATVGKLAAGIIHDFKSPMAIIRGSAELLSMGKGGPEKVERHCKNINQQIDRMVEMARDVLEYSKGQSILELQAINLQEYAESIIAFHAPAFEQSQIRLGIVHSPTLNLKIDPNRFRRVIDNLLNNAREVLQPNGHVWLQWREETNRIVFEVLDDGPGIPQEIRASLFEPFMTSRKEGGTGLGLSIAKKIVEDHGANIEVLCEPGKGTRFQIHLPISLRCDPDNAKHSRPEAITA